MEYLPRYRERGGEERGGGGRGKEGERERERYGSEKRLAVGSR